MGSNNARRLEVWKKELILDGSLLQCSHVQNKKGEHKEFQNCMLTVMMTTGVMDTTREEICTVCGLRAEVGSLPKAGILERIERKGNCIFWIVERCNLLVISKEMGMFVWIWDWYWDGMCNREYFLKRLDEKFVVGFSKFWKGSAVLLWTDVRSRGHWHQCTNCLGGL